MVEAVGDGTLRDIDRDAVDFQVGELLRSRPGITGAFLADADCTLTAVKPATPEIVGKNFAFRDWCHGVQRTGRPYVSEAYRTQIVGNSLVVAAIVPIREGRSSDAVPPAEPVAYLAAVFTLTEIQSFVEDLADEKGISLTIADARGTLLADADTDSLPSELYTLADDPLIGLGLLGEAGVAETGVGRERVVAAYTPVSSLGWVARPRCRPTPPSHRSPTCGGPCCRSPR